MIKIKYLTIILIVLLFSNSYAKVFIDQEKREIDIKKNPQRVISFAPSITEVIFALKKESVLKGVSLFSNYPKSAQELPKIGSFVNLNIEKILMLKPDLCIAVKDGNSKKQISMLESFGIKVYATSPFTLNSIIATIYEIGEILDATDEAKYIISDIKKRVGIVKAKSKKITKKPKIFFQIGIKPIVSAGKGTYINELIEIAGGDNIAKNFKGYPKFSIERVVAENPDIIIISSMYSATNKNKFKESWAKFKKLKAVQNDNIFLINSDIFDRPSPRVIKALETLFEIIETFE